MTAPLVWQLCEPKYSGGDAESSYINGELEWPCELPDFECAKCRRARSGDDERNIPLWLSEDEADALDNQETFETPEDYDAFMTDFAQRVSGDPRNAEFVRLWRERRTIVPLPVKLLVPTVATAAILHSSGEVLVRADVAEELGKAGAASGARFAPVTHGEVDTKGTRASPPSSKFKPGPHARRGGASPSYTILLVGEVTGVPVGVTRDRCSGCGRVVDKWKQRRLVLPSASWRQSVDFAYLATTLHVLVSDQVKQVLERDQNPNVCFERVLFS